MVLLKKIINKIVYWNITHNFIFNNILIWFNLEKKVTAKFNPYNNFVPDANKSAQENAGYSNRTEINEVIEKSKIDLQSAVKKHVKSGGRILDIGCGPGMYLKLFKEGYDLSGTDINSHMLAEAQSNVPQGKFYHGNFLDMRINERFDFIFCIGVLIYIPKSDISAFFDKIHGLLNENGILYLNYPHAISYADTLYSNLTYIQYSPDYIEKLISNRFKVLHHQHAFDGRKIGKYDRNPYKSLNPNTHRTYKNSYLLIAAKF